MTGSEWTCGRCGVTLSFMPGVAQPSELPANWGLVNGVPYCLGCLRRQAGEDRAAGVAEQSPAADRLRADAEGRVEFELGRAPDQGDTRVARACGTNVALVRGVRERLRAYPTRPA